jgi:hypothetical protein
MDRDTLADHAPVPDPDRAVDLREREVLRHITQNRTGMHGATGPQRGLAVDRYMRADTTARSYPCAPGDVSERTDFDARRHLGTRINARGRVNGHGLPFRLIRTPQRQPRAS